MTVTSEALYVRSGARWWMEAACRGADVNLFFKPDKRDGVDRGEQKRREAVAKALCRSCPVISACLAEAMVTGDRYAIRAAYTPHQERRRLGLHRRR